MANNCAYRNFGWKTLLIFFTLIQIHSTTTTVVIDPSETQIIKQFKHFRYELSVEFLCMAYTTVYNLFQLNVVKYKTWARGAYMSLCSVCVNWVVSCPTKNVQKRMPPCCTVYSKYLMICLYYLLRIQKIACILLL